MKRLRWQAEALCMYLQAPRLTQQIHRLSEDDEECAYIYICVWALLYSRMYVSRRALHLAESIELLMTTTTTTMMMTMLMVVVMVVVGLMVGLR